MSDNNTHKINYSELISRAFKARMGAYAPYSNFYVGAAILDIHGTITTGANIENSSYGATICAERSAVAAAVSAYKDSGHHPKGGILRAIAIVGGIRAEQADLSGYAYPCGICRQVLSELAAGDMQIIVARSIDDYKVFKMRDLLPNAFTDENLKT